jgi:hypothetical protein
MSQADTTTAPRSSPASPATPAPPGPAPDDRATSFQAVQGEPEHYNGAELMVIAYAALWVILIAWVALVWRKQASLTSRLDDLERVIDEAARNAGNPAAGASDPQRRGEIADR